MSYPNAHGFFCWPELVTTDVAAAKDFYAGLFGWTYEEQQMPEFTYTEGVVDGTWAAGIMPKLPSMPAEVPSHWGVYFACDDVDASCAKVKELGGTIVLEPWDIPKVGRIAVVTDSTGAFFMLFKMFLQEGAPQENPKEYPSTHGFFTWPELITCDVAKAKAFYSGLFGWDYEDMDMGEFTYSSAKIGEAWVGGMMLKPATMPAEVPPHWGSYFAVVDVDASTAKVKELGGQVFMEPWDIEGVGRMSTVVDPTGAVFMLFKMAPQG